MNKKRFYIGNIYIATPCLCTLKYPLISNLIKIHTNCSYTHTHTHKSIIISNKVAKKGGGTTLI